MMQKVFVIDYELISPISLGKENLHESLKSNVKGEQKVERFDVRGLPFKVAAEIKADLKPLYENENGFIKETCSYDRKFELLVSCYHLAKERFQKICNNLDPVKGGVVLGVGSDVTPFEKFENEMIGFFGREQDPYKSLIFNENTRKGYINKIWNPYDIHSIYIAEKLGLAAFQKSTLTACTSSTQAIVSAFDAIKSGECDVVVAGGTDSIINALALSSFGKLGVIPESDGTNSPTCLVFDKNRVGTLAGEGAGLAIFVSESYMERNDLTPIAEIVSYGNTLDGYKITAPDPEGTYIKKAMNIALEMADLDESKIDYIQAHGTATRHNDVIELKAIKEVFGTHSQDVLISGTKDRHGHAIGAAGIQEFNILMNCLENDFLPSNMNMRNPIEDDMSLMTQNINKRINYAMTNNFAFGGVNTVVIVKQTKI